MMIRFGYEIKFYFQSATPVLLLLSPHPSNQNRLLYPESIQVEPSMPMQQFTDIYGNEATRLLAPEGELRLFYNAVMKDSGQADPVHLGAEEWPIDRLPVDALPFLLDSRYCEAELLANTAWELFGRTKAGWDRVQAICDWVYEHVEFGYQFARATRTAAEVYQERRGVCRDFTHLAVAFCRAMNIPARYCNGYLGDIGIPPDPSPMDFNAWFEVFLGGKWHTFDARHNTPRIGRILVSRGRDAKDTAMTTSFGMAELKQFTVWTDEVKSARSENRQNLSVARG
jgi:transglutaminase-like putative cysteine protease